MRKVGTDGINLVQVAKKQLLSIDCRYRKRIEQKLLEIGDISAPPPDLKKLSQPEDHYRLRVGDYRIIFTPQGDARDICYVVAVKRRTSTTYLHEECMPYGNSVY